MNPFRTLLAICAIALPAGAFIAGCGGDEESEADPQAVLDETFNNPEKISSGDVSLTATGTVEGDAGGSFDLTLGGPLQSDPDDPTALPQLDWDVSVSAEGAGQSFEFEGGLTITEDNAYIEYGGETYEVGADTFNQFKESAEQAAGDAQTEATEEGGSFSEQFKAGCAASLEAQGGDPAACDFDITAWLSEPTNEGVEDIDGTEAVKISSDINVATMLEDLVSLGTAVPGATGGVDPSIIQSQLGVFEDAVESASFSVYSGEEDNILRGFDFDLAIDPSSIPGAAEAGVSGADLGLDMRIAGVNEPQTIEAPTGAKPLEDLLGQFGLSAGDLGALEDLGGLPGASAGGGKGGGAATPDADALDAYSECIEQAQGIEELNSCTDQL